MCTRLWMIETKASGNFSINTYLFFFLRKWRDKVLIIRSHITANAQYIGFGHNLDT